MSVHAVWFLNDTNPPSGNEINQLFRRCLLRAGHQRDRPSSSKTSNQDLLLILITPLDDRDLGFIRGLESFQTVNEHRRLRLLRLHSSCRHRVRATPGWVAALVFCGRRRE